MKVLLVGNNDLFLLPFAKFYIELFEQNSIEFKFIYWERSGNEITDVDERYIPFTQNLNTYGSRFLKIKGYIKFRKFANSLIGSKEYDSVVFLNTQTIIICTLFKKYKKINYIYDYRDESFEKFLLYRKIVEARIEKSKLTVMSSPGFINLFSNNLLKNNIAIRHNNKFDKIFHFSKDKSDKIRVCFWGMVRHVEYLFEIIKLFDPFTFEFSFFGEGYVDKLKQLCDEKGINNVKFYGKYNPKNLKVFADKTDILLNCYPNESIQKEALTCKMYEGICFNIPQIVTKNSFMDNYLNKYNYPHFSIAKNEFNVGNFLEFYNNLDYEKLRSDGEKILQTIKNDNNNFREKLLEVLCYGNKK